MRLMGFAEKLCAAAQGKGTGSFSTSQEARQVARLLNGRTAALALDIGGNVGNYSAALRKIYPHIEIRIFEPAVVNVAALRSRFSGDPSIVIEACAVSDTAGQATLFSDSPGSGLASLTQRRLSHVNISLDMAAEVRTIRFEDYYKAELEGRLIDIAKLDIEGYELSALRGFGKAIEYTRIVQFEFGGCNIDTRTFFQDFWYFFRAHNFELFRITPLGIEPLRKYSEMDECFRTTNFIARNRGLA